MRPEEIAALGRLAGEAAAAGTEQVRGVHDGIAGRVWRAMGPGATPVRIVYDGIAHFTYAAVRDVSRRAIRTGGIALSALADPEGESIERTRIGRAALAALNAAVGDRLEPELPALALPMTLRRGGHDIPPRQDVFRRVFPHATPRLAVFVHGPFQTEEAWARGAPSVVPYGYRLQAELGYTPLYLRYNTGRSIDCNGAALAELMEAIVREWPTRLDEIALFGHSTGGLVIESAVQRGAEKRWASHVRHLFTLATPHRGLTLEQVLGLTSRAVAKLPETRSIAGAMSRRSEGLREAHAPLRQPGPHPRAQHYFISATVTRDPNSLLGRVLGDLLVLHPSSWAHDGPGERMRFPIDHYAHVGRMHHFELLNHPVIYATIRRWLTSRRALPASSSTQQSPPRARVKTGSQRP